MAKPSKSETTPAVRAPVPRPRARARHAARRDEITDTAAAVFARKGFHATSIVDLVEATGLQRGGLYHYIKSKNHLLIRIHERFITPLLASAEEIAGQGHPPDVELRLLARAVIEDIVEYHDQVTVFLHEWRIIEGAPEWKDVRRARKELENIVTGCIERGVAQGLFRQIESGTAMRGFLGMINYTYQWLSPSGNRTPEAVADEFADIFLNGLMAPKAGRKRAAKAA